jgi:hypothetical protein
MQFYLTNPNIEEVPAKHIFSCSVSVNPDPDPAFWLKTDQDTDPGF